MNEKNRFEVEAKNDSIKYKKYKIYEEKTSSNHPIVYYHIVQILRDSHIELSHSLSST